ncbi:MAG: hypothetical protein MUE90_07655, partial [Thermoanaerobaculales bacterium]|nr:hypothetical protein [Thermoanaerobaculales bacterium]
MSEERTAPASELADSTAGRRRAGDGAPPPSRIQGPTLLRPAATAPVAVWLGPAPYLAAVVLAVA